jgi:CRISPR-associated RAMP protein (TIGR02581 family)
MSVFAAFYSRLRVQATLEMQTALSVGARLSLEPTGTDLPVVKGPDGLPFIPGSSIKGAVRSQAERILRTVNHRPHLWACDPFADPCVSGNRKTELWQQAERQNRQQADVIFARSVWEVSCTACRLFGSPWFAGRLAFKDAYLVNADDLPVITQIRDGVGIDRDLGAARSGIKYDFETVVPGARFDIEILAENLEDWEVGFLLAVLHLWEEGTLPLGGKVTRGPGWGVLREVRLTRVRQEDLVDYLIQGKTQPVAPEPFLQAFQEWLKKEAGHA